MSLTYDSEHTRIQMTAPSGTTTYLNDPISGAMEEKLAAGSTATWHDYIQADGHIVAEKFSGATNAVRYIVADHLGSTAIVTDETGAVVERDAYDARRMAPAFFARNVPPERFVRLRRNAHHGASGAISTAATTPPVR